MSSTVSLGPDGLHTAASSARPRTLRGIINLVPAEMLKYAIVGFSGIGVNLVVMALILHQTTWRDWRASLTASVASTLSNYMWNNFWTFRSRAHTGLRFVRRYMVYFAVSLAGLAVTTITYAFTGRALVSALEGREIAAVLPISHLRAPGGLGTPLSALLLCQFVAILSGTLCNYLLNRTFTWPHPERR